MHFAVVILAAVTICVERPWLDPTKPINQRVSELLAEMTLQEKVNQLLHVWVSVTDETIKTKYGVTGVGAAYLQQLSANSSCNLEPECRLDARNALQQYLIDHTRLGIPITIVCETLHMDFDPLKKPHTTTMNSNVLGTAFPMPVSQGASWNTTVIQSVASAIAAESYASGATLGFSPELQVITDPRFGRMIENFGSDPYLVSTYATAAVHGLTGTPSEGNTGPSSHIKPGKLISEAKHFAAYGYGGHDGAPADISIPMFYDVYLKPWKAFVEAGGRGCMAAHNSINGQPCHSSQWLLSQVFREELGCQECFVGSDFDDVWNLNNFYTADPGRYPGHPQQTDASIQALIAGVDQDLGGGSYPTLVAATQQGLLDVKYINKSVENILRAKFASGVFDNPIIPASSLSVLHCKQHQDIAREAAAQGVVLLQNPQKTLPLRTPVNIALLGPNAGCAPGETDPCGASYNMVGGYSAQLAAGQVITVESALKNMEDVTMQYVRGVEVWGNDTSGIPTAVATVGKAEIDVAILVLGDGARTVGEATDRIGLDIPGEQLTLLQEVLTVGKPTIVILVNGRVATFGEGANSRYGAHNAMLSNPHLTILEAWTPGEQGGPAIVDVLFGLRQPTARLAQPFPSTVGQIHSWTVPWYHQHQGDYGQARGSPFAQPRSIYGGSYAPLWCFGYGLSYSNYTMSDLVVSTSNVTSGAVFSASVTVVEQPPHHPIPGAFTFQVYYTQLSASRQVRNRLYLLGYAKEHIAVGGGPVTVAATLNATNLGYTVWDPSTGSHAYGVEPGQYMLFGCYSACDCPMNATFTVVS